jgi:hypothetical protein
MAQLYPLIYQVKTIDEHLFYIVMICTARWIDYRRLNEYYVCDFIKLSYLIRYLNQSSPNGLIL